MYNFSFIIIKKKIFNLSLYILAIINSYLKNQFKNLHGRLIKSKNKPKTVSLKI